jgi:hypothetical protein
MARTERTVKLPDRIARRASVSGRLSFAETALWSRDDGATKSRRARGEIET